MQKDIAKEIKYVKGAVTSKVIEKGRLNITLFCMAKDTEISEHTTTREALIHVIEGSGTIIVDKQPLTLKKGKLIYMNRNAPHSLKVKKNTSFLLFLFH